MSTATIWQIRSTASADTERLGELLGKWLKALPTGRQAPAVLELVSDLGGGKTTFVRGLAAGLGSKNQVTSPTFTLSRIYKADQLEIHHFDFYRLSEPGVVADQLKESLQDPRVITVVEWSQIVQNVLPNDRLTIHFKMVDSPDERLIEIKYPESKRELITKLETDWQEVEP